MNWRDYEVNLPLIGCWGAVLLTALIWFVMWIALWGVFS
jgi:hypothetical protein